MNVALILVSLGIANAPLPFASRGGRLLPGYGRIFGSGFVMTCDRPSRPSKRAGRKESARIVHSLPGSCCSRLWVVH